MRMNRPHRPRVRPTKKQGNERGGQQAPAAGGLSDVRVVASSDLHQVHLRALDAKDTDSNVVEDETRR